MFKKYDYIYKTINILGYLLYYQVRKYKKKIV